MVVIIITLCIERSASDKSYYLESDSDYYSDESSASKQTTSAKHALQKLILGGRRSNEEFQMIQNQRMRMIIKNIRFLINQRILTLKGPDYLPNGPQTNVPQATVTNDRWVLCHNQSYNVNLDDEQIDTIQAKCSKKKVLMACKRVGSTVFNVLAWADKSTVFGTTDRARCRLSCKGNIAQGTKWYRSTPVGALRGAWGFAPSNGRMDLHDTDVGNGPDRISYFINNPNQSGLSGWRCGTTTNLHARPSSSQWELELYHGN